MRGLLELQTAFAEGVLAAPEPGLLHTILDDGIGAEARFAIYRNHYRITLEEALATTFPVTRQLVGSAFFAIAARRFVASRPPAGPCLFEYGAGFSAFLASLAELAAYPFVPSVCRLEWGFNIAFHAADHRPLAPADLSAMAPEAYADLRLRLAPSTVLFVSRHPALAIWQGHQQRTEGAAIRVEGRPCQLLLLRQDEAIAWRELDQAELAFLAALRRGQTLAQAHDAALRKDAAFDLAAAFGRLLGEGSLAGFRHPAETRGSQ